jgi:hypothetical protein
VSDRQRAREISALPSAQFLKAKSAVLRHRSLNAKVRAADVGFRVILSTQKAAAALELTLSPLNRVIPPSRQRHFREESASMKPAKSASLSQPRDQESPDNCRGKRTWVGQNYEPGSRVTEENDSHRHNQHSQITSMDEGM